mmetsp:Transcript_39042/g.103421  ORF Transcript_39042/g.103421 Transcript_39042/m.103421 type:complete len:204 (+) Transcript_39042:770-1381(+)
MSAPEVSSQMLMTRTMPRSKASPRAFMPPLSWKSAGSPNAVFCALQKSSVMEDADSSTRLGEGISIVLPSCLYERLISTRSPSSVPSLVKNCVVIVMALVVSIWKPAPGPKKALFPSRQSFQSQPSLSHFPSERDESPWLPGPHSSPEHFSAPGFEQVCIESAAERMFASKMSTSVQQYPRSPRGTLAAPAMNLPSKKHWASQ